MIYQASNCILGWERRQYGGIQTSVTNHPCRTRTESRRENSWYKSQLHSFPWQTEQLGQWIWWPRTLHTSVTGVVLRAVHVSPRYDYRLYMYPPVIITVCTCILPLSLQTAMYPFIMITECTHISLLWLPTGTVDSGHWTDGSLIHRENPC